MSKDQTASKADSSVDELETTETDATAEATPPDSSTSRVPWLVVALAVVAVVALVVGVVGLVQGHRLRDTPAAENDALVDARATARVEAEVSQGLARILTYDYADPAPTEASARQVLEGEAKKQYAELFAELRKRAAGQQLTLTAKVRSIGVERLAGDRARLLVFLDQTSKRASDAQSNLAAAQVAVTAHRVDGRWRISGLQPI